MVRRQKIKKKPWNNRREIFLFRAMDNHGELMVEDASRNGIIERMHFL